MATKLTAFEKHLTYNCSKNYTVPLDEEKWLPCPVCGLKPRVWEFDYGRYAVCGCWNTSCDRFRVRAESAASIYARTKSLEEYKSSALRDAWNLWASEGTLIPREKGRF